MVVLFPEPLNPKAEAVLTSNGYPQPSHIAMQLEQEDINNDVLILTMEDKQKVARSGKRMRMRPMSIQ